MCELDRQIKVLLLLPLQEKCPYLEFSWSVFSRIRTEYGEIGSISLYSVRMQENTDLKTPNTATFHIVYSKQVNRDLRPLTSLRKKNNKKTLLCDNGVPVKPEKKKMIKLEITV